MRFAISGTVTNTEVGSYPALSPLPFPDQPEKGGFLSAALSVEKPFPAPRPGITRHHALRSPDFPLHAH